MKAVLYARFSPRPNEEECDSVDKQLERCRKFCEMHEYYIAGEFDDVALSGKNMKDRPGIKDAIALACREKAVLVSYSISRLARNTRDAIGISETLNSAGAQIAFIKESIDTTTAIGRFFFSIVAAFGQLEREQTSEITGRAMRKHQREGRRMSAVAFCPWGFEPDPEDDALMIEVPAEQEVIKMIVEFDADGFSQRKICRALTEVGVLTRAQKPFDHKAVGRILKREKPVQAGPFSLVS